MGAEISGLDLSRSVTDSRKNDIQAAYHWHHLLVFPDQKLNKAEQIAFSRRFGEFELPVNRDYLGADYPELHVVNNIGPSGKPQSFEDIANKGNYFWHTDASYMKRPSSTTMLYAVTLPRSGGDTMFANLAAAYRALMDAIGADQFCQ